MSQNQNQEQENTSNLMSKEEMLSIEGDVFDCEESIEFEYVNLDVIPEHLIID